MTESDTSYTAEHFSGCDVAEHFGFAVRADFWIRAAQQAAGYTGIVFKVQPGNRVCDSAFA
jgi:hypothetical protein